eukprot:m.295527 g.295527  ORF g.295527 m.295527 type:complete len:190 (+) comp16393_c6_seq24:213-782(+)
MAHKTVKTCCVGKDGPDVATGANWEGYMYIYEGYLKNRQPSGPGIRRWENGQVDYGHLFIEGDVEYPYLRKSSADGKIQCLDGQGGKLFEREDKLYDYVMEKAHEAAAKARALSYQPWSRHTHYFVKFEPMHDMVMTALLCAERLRRTDSDLGELPVEIWEMIFTFAETSTTPLRYMSSLVPTAALVCD